MFRVDHLQNPNHLFEELNTNKSKEHHSRTKDSIKNKKEIRRRNKGDDCGKIAVKICLLGSFMKLKTSWL